MSSDSTPTRTCATCGAIILRRISTSDILRGHGRFCSRACYQRSKPQPVVRPCIVCGTPATTCHKRSLQGYGKYCSIRCRSIHSNATEESFWDHCEPQPDDDSCRLWLSATTKFGYGNVRRWNKGYLAHRVAFELTYGPIPSDSCVLHRCDNPPCINPEHLFLGTKRDNTRDMMNKSRDRHPRGMASRSAKLTDSEVLEILALYQSGHTPKSLASQFGVVVGTIYSVINGISWRHITGLSPKTKKLRREKPR